MADRIKGITVQIGGDTTGLSKALSGVNKQIKTTQKELKDVEKLLKLDPSNTKLLEQKQRLLAGAVDETKTKLDGLKAAEKEVKQQFADGVINQSQFDAFNRELIETQQAFDDAKKAAQDFGGVVAQEMKLAGDKVGEVGDKVSNLGQKMLPVTGAVAAVGTASIAAFGELDEGYDTIVTKTGATGEALESLQKSMDNVFGSIPTDAATAGIAIGEVNTRFGSTGAELEDLSRKFIEFANINGTDVNSSIDTVDAVMTKFGVDSSHTGEVLGLMTKVGQDTGISMDSLANTLDTNGATLKEMGLDLTGSINLLAQFEANGVDATTALAGLKKAQQNATANGKTLGDELSNTIIKIKDSKNETAALQAATELFGKKGAAEMTQAIREGRFSVDDLSASLSAYATTVEDTFNATLDPPDQATVALNNLKIAGADLGETMLTAVAPILEQIVDKVKEFAAWFGALDESQKQTIVVIGAVVAAIGPVVMILGNVISGVGSIISVVGSLVGFITGTVVPGITGALSGLFAFLAANPVVLIIAGITAAIVVLVALIAAKGDEIKALLQGVDSFLQGIFAADFTRVFGPVLGEALNAFFANVKNIWDSVKRVFDGVIDFIRGVFTGDWQRAWTGVKEIFRGVFDGLSAVAKAPLNAVIGLVNMAINGINSVIGAINRLPGVKIGHIGQIPYLAKGGILSSGSAVVGEAGPELLTVNQGRAIVQPLTNNNTTNNANYGGVTVNVYAAAGQSVNAIADAVIDRVQHKIDQTGAVWA